MTHAAMRLVQFLVAFGCAGLTALPAAAQLVQGRDTASAELLGLSRWTRAMLEDSLRVRAPGVALASVASARILREVLRFADAEATEFYWQDDEGAVRGPVFVISVVEPQDSARVQLRALPATRPEEAAWPSISAAISDSSGRVDDIALGVAVASYTEVRAVGLDSGFALMVQGDAAGAFRSAPVWRELVRHVSPASLQRARATLASHADPAQRIAALGVLQNFPREDAAWHAIVGALRDPHPYVRGVAVQVLSALAYRHARQVDWRASAGDLRLLLGGTNLPAFIRLVGALQRTGVGPSLAPALLAGGNAELLLAHAGSSVHMVRQSARSLLGMLGGRPDATVEEWRGWALTLRLPRPHDIR